MRSGTPYLVRVCAYLQGGSDLQGGADLKRGLALTWLWTGVIETFKKKINKLGHCHPDRIILDLYLISWSPLLWQFWKDMINTCVLLCACTPVNSCHIVESMHCMTYRLSRWVRDVMNEMLGLLFCQMFSRCYSIVLLLYTSISYVCRCRDILVSSLFSCCICSISYVCRCRDILAFLYFVLFIYLLMFWPTIHINLTAFGIFLKLVMEDRTVFSHIDD